MFKCSFNEIFHFSCCNCFCTLHQKLHTSFLGEISNQNYCYEVQHQNANHIVVLLATLQRNANVKSEWIFLKTPNNMWLLLSEFNVRRQFFSLPALCFCTKRNIDLILAYGDNQAQSR